ARLATGHWVLVHGASGGVGSLAIQLARWRGAHVIGTASARNLCLLRELGAHEAVDYTAAPFEKAIHDVDVVRDTVGGETLEQSWDVLRAGEALISIAGTPLQERAAKLGLRAAFFIVEPNPGQLARIARLVDLGAVRPLVEEAFPLARAREAYERV